MSGNEFGHEQGAKQRPRPAGEPLVHGDYRPVVLLNLFFPHGQAGYKRDVKTALNSFWLFIFLVRIDGKCALGTGLFAWGDVSQEPSSQMKRVS